MNIISAFTLITHSIKHRRIDKLYSRQSIMENARRTCQNFCSEFKEFALRGNVLDLAIGIVIGTVFINVVHSLVDDIITPPLGLLLGGVDFANLTIKMKNFVYKKQPPVVIRYGKFIQALISFVIMAMTLFFVVKGINRLNRLTAKTAKTSTSNNESLNFELTEEIRDTLAKPSLDRL